MIIDYGDCENAAEFALNDLVEREYTFIITLDTGEKFEFQPKLVENDNLVGCKLNHDFEEIGEADIEIPLNTIEKVEC